MRSQQLCWWRELSVDFAFFIASRAIFSSRKDHSLMLNKRLTLTCDCKGTLKVVERYKNSLFSSCFFGWMLSIQSREKYFFIYSFVKRKRHSPFKHEHPTSSVGLSSFCLQPSAKDQEFPWVDVLVLVVVSRYQPKTKELFEMLFLFFFILFIIWFISSLK